MRWLTLDEIKQSAGLLEKNREHGPLLPGVLAVARGGRMPCVEYESAGLQTNFWEGLTQANEVAILLVFKFFREIVTRL